MLYPKEPQTDRTCGRAEKTNNKVVEQRTFLVSPGPEYRILSINPVEYLDNVTPIFKSVPPEMTWEMAWECLVR